MQHPSMARHIQKPRQPRYPFLLQLPYLKPFSRLQNQTIPMLDQRKNQRPKRPRPLRRTRPSTRPRPKRIKRKPRLRNQIRPRTRMAGDLAGEADLVGEVDQAGDPQSGIHTFTWLVLVPLSLICVSTTTVRSVIKSLC